MGQPRIRRRDVLKLVGSAGAMTILVAACSGGGSSSTPSASSAQPAASTAAAPTAASAQSAATPTTAAAAQAAATPTTATSAASTGAAAGPTPTPDFLAAVPVKSGVQAIDWWWPWGGMTGLQALAALAKDFNQTHDNLQVKPLQVATENVKLLAAIAGGNPPTVETGGTWLDEWLSGAATPLDDYIKQSKVLNMSDLFDTNVAGGKVKGVTYGIPAVECFLRWEASYNQDLLDKHNLKADQLPQDWDTLYQWAKEMDVVQSSGAISVMGFDPLDAEGGVWGADPFYWSAALNYKYYDETKGQYTIDSDQMVEAITQIQKFVDLVGAEKLAGFAKSYGTWTESPTAMFPSGFEGANINGYWAPGELVKSAPGKKFTYGWVPMPTARKGTKLACTGGHYGIIPKGSPHPDLGFQIIEYLNTPAAMDIIYKTTGWLGASKSYLSKVDTSAYPGLDFYVNAAKEATQMWGPFFEPVPSFASDQFYKAVDSVNYHKITPKQAAQQVQEAVMTEVKNRFPNGV